jgi:MerR family transcriptional regulator, redox-sensitive transcriptional activator SoxR
MNGNKSKNTPKAILSIGELSARSGLPISTLHFYEEKGIISSFRNSQNQRQYLRGVLRVISLIKAAQGLGFQLDEIKSMLQRMPHDRNPSDIDWEKLGKKWKVELDQKIDSLIQIRDHLYKCIGCGCLSLKDCPLQNPDDKLARKGPGPRLLF